MRVRANSAGKAGIRSSGASGGKRIPDPLLESLGRALRPLPFWIGYKHEKYWRHRLPESAMVAELRETLQMALTNEYVVECEVAYAELNGSAGRKNAAGRPEQIDVAIRSRKTGRFAAAMEVKRDNFDRLAKQDIKALADLDPANRVLRKFLVLFSESSAPPHALVGKTGHAKRKTGVATVRALVRRSYHCFSSIRARPRGRHGHWVILVEVTARSYAPQHVYRDETNTATRYLVRSRSVRPHLD
jgi:hypothetical protein